jgi:hypothetical protein
VQLAKRVQRVAKITIILAFHLILPMARTQNASKRAKKTKHERKVSRRNTAEREVKLRAALEAFSAQESENSDGKSERQGFHKIAKAYGVDPSTLWRRYRNKCVSITQHNAQKQLLRIEEEDVLKQFSVRILCRLWP